MKWLLVIIILELAVISNKLWVLQGDLGKQHPVLMVGPWTVKTPGGVLECGADLLNPNGPCTIKELYDQTGQEPPVKKIPWFLPDCPPGATCEIPKPKALWWADGKDQDGK